MASENLVWLTNTVGVAAGLCSMTSFVPQIAKIWRTRDASTVSLRMYFVTAAAFTLWTTFGFLQGSWPIVASNSVCLALTCTIIALRMRFGDAAG